MSWMGRVHMDTQELLLNVASIARGNDNLEDATDELSAYLAETGWQSPTEVEGRALHASHD